MVSKDTESDYSLAVDFPSAPEPARYFGGANIRRSYVSFYLMPVYADLRDVRPSGALARRDGESGPQA